MMEDVMKNVLRIEYQIQLIKYVTVNLYVILKIVEGVVIHQLVKLAKMVILNMKINALKNAQMVIEQIELHGLALKLLYLHGIGLALLDLLVEIIAV
jgi:hypothetical protein